MKKPHVEQWNDALTALRKASPEQPDQAFVHTLESRLVRKLTSSTMHPTFVQKLFARPLVPLGAAALAVLVVALVLTLPNIRTTTPRNNQAQNFRSLIIDEAYAEENFALKAKKEDALGVDPATTFLLTSKIDFTLGEVQKALSVTPAIMFKITEESSRAFTITPNDLLAPGTVYQFALGATIKTTNGTNASKRYSWAVQAKQAVRVAGMLPRDTVTNVPADTGIEVTFNTSGIEDFAQHFQITPATKGRFAQRGRVFSFIPEERLKPATLYTVTITKGVRVKGSAETLAADVRARFETGSEESSGSAFTYYDTSFASVRPHEAPVLQQPSYKAFATPSAAVYKFQSAEQMIKRFKSVDDIPSWAYMSRSKARVSTDGLSKVGDYTLDAVDDALRFPTGFAAGFYLVDIASPERAFQGGLIVSDLGASLTLAQHQSVLWLYDLATKQPLHQATVTSTLGGDPITSDTQGIARIGTPAAFDDTKNEITRSYFLVQDQKQRTTVVPAEPQSGFGYFSSPTFPGGRRTSNDYWAYLWSDRTLYHPTDTLNVWGVMRSRSDGGKKVDVTLTVETWQDVNGIGAYVPVVQQTVTTGDYATYQASLRLAQLTPGYYTLTASVGDEEVANRSFEVKTFTKPAYHIIVTPDTIAGIDGEEVSYDVQTEFFDGTPAPHIQLSWGGYGRAGDKGFGTFTTDAQGHAVVKGTLHNDDRHYATTTNRSFFPVEAAEGDIASDLAVLVYPSAVDVQASATRHDTTVTLSAVVSAIDRNRPADAWRANYGSFATGVTDPAHNAPVNGTVYEDQVIATKRGTKYDFIEKRVVDMYDYRFERKKVGTFSGTTDANGQYTTTFKLPGDSYIIDVSAKDAKGREVMNTVYIGKGTADDGTDATTSFTLRDDKTLSTGRQENGALTYRIGDQTSMQFLHNGVKTPNQGAYLFVKLQNGVQDVIVRDSSTLPLTFGEADVPNVAFTAVWFDGDSFQVVNRWDLPTLVFDAKSRELTMTLSAKRASYKPGDTASVNVHVTDADGKSARALVNVSAIDEALTTIQWENPPAVLEAIYTRVDSGLLQQYVSGAPLRAEDGAEGGGGGDQPRRDFKDAALFREVETDGSGNATVTFVVPDNITSWRMTAQGVTKDLYAGHAVLVLPVTKPIFGALTMQDAYVVLDRPAVVARAYGAGLSANDDVQVALAIPSLHYSEKGTVKAFAERSFLLPAFTVGTHEVHLTVAQGSARDELVRTITVAPSRLTRTTSVFTDVTAGQQFTGSSAERTTILLSDAGRGRVINNAYNLAWAYGKRLERSLGARIAIDTLKSLQANVDEPQAGFDPFLYQQDDGGISQIAYGGADLSLSAFAAYRSDLFDETKLRTYFVRKLEDKNASREQIGDSVLGLAELRAPVLADINAFLALDGITPQDRLIAGLAYEALGANDKAFTIATSLLKEFGEVQQPYVRLNLGASKDETIINTARFAILAESLKMKERLGIQAYLAVNFPDDALTNLERSISFAKAAAQLDDGVPIGFTFTLDGAEKSVDLAKEPNRDYALSLTSGQIKNFTVTRVAGPVGATILSTVAIDPGNEKADSRLQLERRYSVVGRLGKDMKAGDIVRIDLQPRVAAGVVDKEFFVIDNLPSGLVLLSKPWDRGLGTDERFNYPLEVNGQRITFYSDGSRSFYYYARVLTAGGYAAEPAILQGQNSRDLFNYSGGQSLEIQ